MIDHIGFAVSNVELSQDFYVNALKPLGISVILESRCLAMLAQQTRSTAAMGFEAD